MKIIDDLHHLDGMKGNFGVTEFIYVAGAKQKAAEPVPQLILVLSSLVSSNSNTFLTCYGTRQFAQCIGSGRLRKR